MYTHIVADRARHDRAHEDADELSWPLRGHMYVCVYIHIYTHTRIYIYTLIIYKE